MLRTWLWLVCTTTALGLAIGTVMWSPTRIADSNAALVRELGLSDLCLFTEARYTRHPTQADLHSAFQDHPLALEHFPSGSLLPPPLSESLHGYVSSQTGLSD